MIINTPPQPTVNFELNVALPLADELQRVMIEQLDYALWQLTSSKTLSEKNVHEARKSFKKGRAIVRLLRDEIGKKLYRSQNVTMRDASRQISGLRSSAVMVETLDYLAESFPEALPAAVFSDVRARLVARHEEHLQNILGNNQHAGTGMNHYSQQHLDQLYALRTQIKEWPLTKSDFSLIRPGLKRVYRRGRKCLATTHATPSVESFHDWRKRVKYLRYQVEILVQINPTVMQELASSLHDLSDFLGIDHDLAELHQLLQDEDRLSSNESQRTQIMALVQQKRYELQVGAWRVGEVVYAERPSQFVNRLADYWQTATSQLE